MSLRLRVSTGVVTLISSLMLTMPALGQGSISMEGWPIVEECLGPLPYPTIPQSQWTFEGVIFNGNYDGVRAIRADVSTSYFLALEGGNVFADAGGFSPDGRYFAYPTGSTNSAANSAGDSTFRGDAIEVVTTGPNPTTIRLTDNEIIGRAFSFSNGATGISSVALGQIYWVDNERFIPSSTIGIINPFTGELDPWENSAPLYALSSFSPDFTRAIEYDFRSEIPPKLYDIENDTYITNLNDDSTAFWMPDSTHFLARIAAPESEFAQRLALFNRNGVQLEVVTPFSGSIESIVISPDGNYFTFVLDDFLFLADIANRTIIDLCFEMVRADLPFMQAWSLFSEIVWSPNSERLAFLYDGYPVLLTIETRGMEILRYETNRLIQWSALE